MSRRRSFNDIRAEAVAHERHKVAAFVQTQIGAAQTLVASGVITAGEASLLTARLECFGEQIALGLHDSEGVTHGKE